MASESSSPVWQPTAVRVVTLLDARTGTMPCCGSAPLHQSLDTRTDAAPFRGTVRLPKSPDPSLLYVAAGSLALHDEVGVRALDAGTFLLSAIDGPVCGHAGTDAAGEALALWRVAFSVDAAIAVMIGVDQELLDDTFSRRTSGGPGAAIFRDPALPRPRQSRRE